MAEDRGQGHNHEHEEPKRAQRSEQATPEPQGILTPTSEKLPTYPTSLLGDPRLNGRGNQPVKVALIQQLQQTYGNRAVQRMLRQSGTQGAGALQANRPAQPIVHTSPAIAVQRDIKPGDQLPTLEGVTAKRFERLFPQEELDLEKRALRDAKENLKDPNFMKEVLDAAAKTQPDSGKPNDEDLKHVQGILELILLSLSKLKDLAAAERDFTDIYCEILTKARQEIGKTFFHKTYENSKTRRGAFLDRTEARLLAPGTEVTPTNLAKAFQEKRKDVQIAGNYQMLDKTERARWSDALKQMPTISHLIKTKITPPENRANPGWKDGGSLLDTINVIEDGNKERSKIDDSAFKANVGKADQFIKGIVEPDLLGMVNKPTINVHTRNAQDNWSPLGFRAFHLAGQVHVAHNDNHSIVVHEVGHYLEDRLPSEIWHDIRLLMQSRHEVAGGGTKATHGSLGPMVLEGRYKGEYPATGKYTSKAYEGRGPTEVMSMTLEFLSHPEKVLNMIENDPQQAAVILRGLRPKEYDKIPDLREFDPYLPE